MGGRPLPIATWSRGQTISRAEFPSVPPQLILPSGDYAVALFHDENGNGRVDTMLGVPSEGVGFSNNPRLLFGPPSFRRAAVALTNQTARETVRLRYFL